MKVLWRKLIIICNESVIDRISISIMHEKYQEGVYFGLIFVIIHLSFDGFE